MKTKLHKKSFATGLAALVLSTGAFLGASLLVSQDADADCSITNKKGEAILTCAGGGKCESTYLGHTLKCDGTKVANPPSAATE